ncbi:MAG: FdtA/QdtA family cupin domain-containing protein [Cyclobacteriaceae bacterium]|nr:FdtA/QdtA family cupin domain-containing protein [Cyclobacteriaceae bacterium]
MNAQVKLFDLPKIIDPRGNLTFLQYPNQLPFEIQRVFWTYDVPGGEIRGGHAYKKQHEVIIALSGSFDVVITDMTGKSSVFSLNRSYHGLYVPAFTWRHIQNFSTNALALHLSNSKFDPLDYIRDIKVYFNSVSE